MRLCAFSVFSARMRYDSDSSGEISTVSCLRPSIFAAARRCRPFGVQKRPSSPRTTISGSRNAAVASMAPARRLACVGERSRWNGVGCTALNGQRREQQRAAAQRLAIGAERRAAGLAHQLDDGARCLGDRAAARLRSPTSPRLTAFGASFRPRLRLALGLVSLGAAFFLAAMIRSLRFGAENDARAAP